MSSVGLDFTFTQDVGLLREKRDRQVGEALELWRSSRKAEAWGAEVSDDPMNVIKGKFVEAFGPKLQQASQ